MKSKSLLLLVALSLLLSGCKKPEKEPNEYYGKYQKACVRMKVQNNTSNGRKAQVVGDSTAVWKCVRYGVSLHNHNRVYDIVSPDGIYLLWSLLFQRDTTECVYIFGYPCVIDYAEQAPDENGYWNGVPGTEIEGFLLRCDNFVISGIYDTVHNIYYDPFSGKPENEDDPSYGWDGGSCPSNWVYDTLGYIPNSIVHANRERLIPLFKEGKYSEMIKIMENDYVIYTCTGEEYRELARQGLN